MHIEGRKQRRTCVPGVVHADTPDPGLLRRLLNLRLKFRGSTMVPRVVVNTRSPDARPLGASWTGSHTVPVLWKVRTFPPNLGHFMTLVLDRSRAMTVP
jgi:hypothetical protein